MSPSCSGLTRGSPHCWTRQALSDFDSSLTPAPHERSVPGAFPGGLQASVPVLAPPAPVRDKHCIVLRTVHARKPCRTLSVVSQQALFDTDIKKRYTASRSATTSMRDAVIERVMATAGLPRLGTSGAANAYLLFVGSEFGSESTSARPHYSPATMGEAGWDSLWRLRVGEVNPHFDAPLEVLACNDGAVAEAL